MKKGILLIFSLLLIVFVGWANPIDKQTAKKVAQNFFAAKTGIKNIEFDVEFEYKYDGKTAIYIFARKEGGFVLVSADDYAEPILGYSPDRKFPLPIESPEVKWWIEGYAKQIVNLQKPKSLEIKEKWTKILEGNLDFVGNKPATYLVQTTWNQTGGDDQYPYNYFCPKGTPVGCVATATAQVMRYWEYPNTGRGWHTYVHPMYGRLTAVFDTITFRWDNMPLNASSFDVALLSYVLGVAVDMNYDPSGSGSYTFDLTYVLPNYFKYSHDIMYYSRAYIESLGGEQAWKDTLIKQINNAMPVIYAGYDPDAGGHAFICDGYDPDIDQFHFNWGWGGSYDGWYSVNSLTPGSNDFTTGQSIVANIRPPATGETVSFVAVKTQSPFDRGVIMRYIDAVDENIAYAAPSEGNFIAKTVTGGAIWDKIELKDYKSFGVSMVFALNKDTIFVPVYNTSGTDNTYLLRSTDGGKTWTPVVSGEVKGASFFNVVHFFNSERGVLQGDPTNGEFEIYITNDGGDTWTRVNGVNIPNPAYDNEYGIVGIFFGNSQGIWFSTNKGRIYRSMDFGQTWDVYNLITPDSIDGDPEGDDWTEIAIAFDNTGKGVAVETYIHRTPNDTNTYLYYYISDDYGQTWTKFTPNPKYLLNESQIRYVPSIGAFISVGRNGITYSFDRINWFSMTNYLNLFSIYAADFLPSLYGYLGSYKWSNFNGAWIFGENRAALPDYTVNPERACLGSSATFYDATIGIVDSIVWNFGEDATPQVAYGPGPHQVTYSSAGVKNVSIKVINDGNVYEKTKIYYVDDGIPANLSDISGEKYPQLGNVYTYSVEYQPVNYDWTIPTGWKFVSQTDTNVVNVKVEGLVGQYEISVKAVNGCGESDPSTLVVFATAGIEKAYPNPAQQYAYIENTEGATVIVVSNEGKIIERIDNAQYLTILNVTDSKYKNGIYTVYIEMPDGTKRTVRLIVIK